MPAGRARKLSASQEDYLEAILSLTRDSGAARVRDIAERLGVAMPSVSGALKALARRKLVHYQPYELVTLSDRGGQLAEGIVRRHGVLRRFLTDVLGMDRPTAEANACRLEHAADDVLLQRLGWFVEFLSQRKPTGRNCLAAFRRFCSARQNGKATPKPLKKSKS